MEDIKVKRWIEKGEFSGEKDSDAILDYAGGLLDEACTYEILGQNLFEGKDGKFYTVTVEAVIAEAAPEFVKSILADKKNARKRAAEDCVRLDEE